MKIEDHIHAVPDFPKPGILFRDITPLLANPQAFRATIDMIVARWHGKKVDVIAALDARGFLLGAPLAYAMQVPLIPIRKKGKLPRETVAEEYSLEYGTNVVEMHKDDIKEGQEALIVDDVLATGGTALAACKLIERVGARVLGCQFLMELEGLGGRTLIGKYPMDTLVTYKESA